MSNLQLSPDGTLSPNALEVHRLDSFGVPAFWVPSEGPVTAGLVFHVGRAAEPAALAGITHLIGHLVTESLGLPAHQTFDPVGVDVTGFSTSGSPEEVAAVLGALTVRLSVVPLEGLDEARATLKAESAGKIPGPREQLLRLRHGAMGYGALSFDEFGVRKAGHLQIGGWANRFMNTSNAAIWMTGPMIDEIRVRLVRGSRAQIDPHLLDVPTPGAAYGSEGHVAVSLVAPRSHALDAAVHIAGARARQELCVNRQISRYVEVTSERLDHERVEVVAIADAHPDRDDEVARVLLWVLDCLAAAPPSIDEINSYRDQIAWRYFDPAGGAALASAHAIGHVTAARAESWSEASQSLGSITGDAVSTSLQAAMSTLLITATRKCGVLAERFEYVGNWAPSPVPGARVKAVKLPGEVKPDRELWIGPQGLTIREGDRIASVRYSECVMMLRDESGYRELISENGGRVVILANAWQRGDQIVASIDSEMTPERTLILDEDVDRRMGYIGAERRRWER